MMGDRLFSRIALCALLATLAACNDSSSDDPASASGASVDSSDPNTVAERNAAATPQTGLVLSCPTATATVQFAACPGGNLVYAVPAAGVYAESSTIATTGVPAYAAATHVFQLYQNAVEVVICTSAETPGLTVGYTTDPCTMNHAVAAGPAAGGSSSSSGGSSSSSSSSSSRCGSSSSSSGASTAPQIGLALSCPTATAPVQFASCPGGKLVYAVPATGVYVESSTIATTTVPAYAAATHVFQPYQNAVEVVICQITETPGLTVGYTTDPCTMYHAVVAGPAAGGSSSSSGGSSSSSSSGGVSSGSSSGGSSSSGSSSSGGKSSSSSSGGSSSSSRSGGGGGARTELLTYPNDTHGTA